MKEVPRIHISDIRSYKNCRRQWLFASPIKKNLTTRKPIAHFIVGTLFHQVFELVARKETDWETALQIKSDNVIEGIVALFNASPLYRGDIARTSLEVDKMSVVIAHYYNFYKLYKGEYNDSEFKFISLEREFDLPLFIPNTDNTSITTKVFRGARISGRIDGVVQHIPTGKYYLWENKTSSRPDFLINSLDNDEQSGVYIWAASQFYHVPISGIIYNIINKKTPEVPTKLKDGSLSKAKSYKGTFASYLTEVRRVHPEFSDADIKSTYGDILSILGNTPQDFFQRVVIEKTPNQITKLMIDIYHTILEMLSSKTYIYPSPNPTSCLFCLFHDPCLRMNKGDYIQANKIVKNDYTTRKGYEQTSLE